MAKKKDCKVSIASVDKVLKDCRQEPRVAVVRGNNDVSFEMEVKQLLPFEDYCNMVNSAVNGVFIVNKETGVEEFHAEYVMVAKAAAAMYYVANFKTDMSIARIYELLYSTNVLELICQYWNHAQREAFDIAFMDAVEQRQKVILATEREKLIRISNQLDSATQAFERITALFDGVDPNTIQEAIKTMAGMDELKLANAVIDARDKDFVEKRRAELSVVK